MRILFNLFSLIMVVSGIILVVDFWAIFIMAQASGLPTQMPGPGQHSVLPISEMPAAIRSVHLAKLTLAYGMTVFVASLIGRRYITLKVEMTLRHSAS